MSSLGVADFMSGMADVDHAVAVRPAQASARMMTG
jgi:hypothetical protein